MSNHLVYTLAVVGLILAGTLTGFLLSPLVRL